MHYLRAGLSVWFYQSVFMFCLAVEFSLFVEPRDPSKLTYTGDRAGCESAVRKFGALGAFALPPPPKPRPLASSKTEQTPKSATAAGDQASLEIPAKRPKPSDPFQTPSPYHNAAAAKVAAAIPRIDPVKSEDIASVSEDLLISPEFTTRSAVGVAAKQTESTRKDVKMFFSPPPPKKPAGPEKSPGSATRRSARLAAKSKPRAAAPMESLDSSLADTPNSTKAKRASSVPHSRNRGGRASGAAVTKSKRKITFSPDTRAGRRGEEATDTSNAEACVSSDISVSLVTTQSVSTALTISAIAETPSVSASRTLRSARRAHLRAHVNTTGCTAKPPSPDPSDIPNLNELKSSADAQLVQSLESKFPALSLGASDTPDPFETPTASAATTAAGAASSSLASFSSVRVLPDEYSDESSALVCLLSNFDNIYFDPVAETEETSRSIRYARRVALYVGGILVIHYTWRLQ